MLTRLFVEHFQSNKTNEIKTKEQARQYGIDFQNWASNKDLSYGELCHFQNILTTVAEKFDLVDEFIENGII